MSQGTLYVWNGAPRSEILRDIVNYLQLDIQVKYFKDSPEFESLFPLKRLPSFLTPENDKLHEVVVLIPYLLNLHPRGIPLLGSTDREKLFVSMYISFLNSDFSMSIGGFVFPSLGEDPFYEHAVIKCQKNFDIQIDYIDSLLKSSKYLTNNSYPNIADFYCLRFIHLASLFLYNQDCADKYPRLAKWVDDVANNFDFTHCLKGLKACLGPVIINDPTLK